MSTPTAKGKSSRLAQVFGHIVAAAHDPDVTRKEAAKRARTLANYFRPMATPLLALTLQEIDRQRWTYLLSEKTGQEAAEETSVLDKLTIFRRRLEKRARPVDPDSPEVKESKILSLARIFGDVQRACYTPSEEQARDSRKEAFRELAEKPAILPVLIKAVQATQNWESASFTQHAETEVLTPKDRGILEKRESFLLRLREHDARTGRRYGNS